MNGNKVRADRQNYVVKANDLIRSTRYNLTTQQQKIVLFAISKIKKDDDPRKEYEIDIDELCAACGIQIDGGGFYYKAIKNDLRALTSRLWVQMPDNSEATVAWISDAVIIPLSGKVYIKFHERMIPYLFDLREKYTQYHLEDVLVFRCKYAIRLYEILRSYTTQDALNRGKTKYATLKVDDLRNVLDVHSYPRWADFNRFVIRKAVNEINTCNEEMHIDYYAEKNGQRNIASVTFEIKRAKAKQYFDAVQEKRKRL